MSDLLHPKLVVRRRIVVALALERNIVAVSGPCSCSHSARTSGTLHSQVFGSAWCARHGGRVVRDVPDLLDGVYQHPGGWIGDRYGRRRALMLFVGLAMLGYALLLVGTALAVRLCRARARHGLVEHGQPYPVRGGGRRATEGASSPRLHGAVHPPAHPHRRGADATWSAASQSRQPRLSAVCSGA